MVTLTGGPLDGKLAPVHEGSEYEYQAPDGSKHSYHRTEWKRAFEIWEYREDPGEEMADVLRRFIAGTAFATKSELQILSNYARAALCKWEGRRRK